MRNERRFLFCSLASLALLAGGCASAPRRPAPGVAERAAGARSYSAELSVSLKGRELRGRSRVIVAYQRPDALRVEVPGPTGARLVAIARDGKLTALFPGERGVYTAPASSEELELLLGIALTPQEVGELLLGRPTPRLKRYEASWGSAVPSRIRATLPDGARLGVTVRDPRIDEVLAREVFEAAVPAGYRVLEREEARSIWSRR